MLAFCARRFSHLFFFGVAPRWISPRECSSLVFLIWVSFYFLVPRLARSRVRFPGNANGWCPRNLRMRRSSMTSSHRPRSFSWVLHFHVLSVEFEFCFTVPCGILGRLFILENFASLHIYGLVFLSKMVFFFFKVLEIISCGSYNLILRIFCLICTLEWKWLRKLAV